MKMTNVVDIKIINPDIFNIKDVLRKNKIHNSEFIDLTLKSYEILSQMKNQKLSITESLKSNENINIFDHQILAAQKIKNELGGTAILADEVGLGKTIEAGIIIKEYLTTRLATRILILTPPSLVSQWKDEMSSKFNVQFFDLKDDCDDYDLINQNLWIVSHASAIFPNQSEKIKSVYWDLVVVDEAHSMKNANTLKHKFVKNLSKRNLLLLTATPIQNNLEEMYNLIELLRPGYLGTWQQFKSRYILGTKSRIINPMFKDELQQTLSELIIRTTRREAKKYIKFTNRIAHTKILKPTQNECELYDGITDVIRDLYSQNYSPLVLMIYQRLASSSSYASENALYKMKLNQMISDETYHHLRKVVKSIRIDSKMLDLLKILKLNKSKFLIFTEFLATQNYIAKILKDNGYSVTLFNGTLNSFEKLNSINQFKNDSQIMISTSAGGEGQNFQFCHNIINYDLPWNPMKIEQRIGRVHRIGQISDVEIFNYALEGTIEGYILELLYTKIELFQMTLGEMDILFEDVFDGESSSTWFKEYMNVADKNEIKNIFSAIGENWKNRKKNITDAVQEFNDNVFKNFNLSVLEDL